MALERIFRYATLKSAQCRCRLHIPALRRNWFEIFHTSLSPFNQPITPRAETLFPSEIGNFSHGVHL